MRDGKHQKGRNQRNDSQRNNTHAEASQPSSREEFYDLLQNCQELLRKTDFYRSFVKACPENMEEIICYGIGNFYTSRQSAPLWQLALALLISGRDKKRKEHSIRKEREEETNDSLPQHATNELANSINCVPMHYFDPKMTAKERKILEQFGVHMILENERACRDVKKNRLDKHSSCDSPGPMLFFMPHCGVSLYTNLLWTNWYSLDQIAIFGNSLQGYLDQCGDNVESATVSRQSHGILKTLQPHWTETPLRTSKNDNALHQIENAFNNSGIISFEMAAKDSDEGLLSSNHMSWPEQPKDYNSTGMDSSGEVV